MTQSEQTALEARFGQIPIRVLCKLAHRIAPKGRALFTQKPCAPALKAGRGAPDG